MSVGGSYTAQQRQAISSDIRTGRTPVCPVCNTPLSVQRVNHTPGVPYVRRRVIALCPNCRRAAAVDTAK